jgi:hypothetical protein
MEIVAENDGIGIREFELDFLGLLGQGHSGEKQEEEGENQGTTHVCPLLLHWAHQSLKPQYYTQRADMRQTKTLRVGRGYS